MIKMDVQNEHHSQPLSSLLTFKVSRMARASKERELMGCFFNEPSRHWHFTDLRQATGLPDHRLVVWLERFHEQNLVRRVKLEGQRSYYRALSESPDYRMRKRAFAFEDMRASGLLAYLASLPAEAVVLFGSMARSDWHTDSDIDVFVLGSSAQIRKHRFEKRMRRDIQLFTYSDRRTLASVDGALLRSIAEGMLLRGDLGFLQVRADG
ncbi:hypothetical protein COV94_01595 [Candidatus Woesearchaeota archaeon CG11_big_fil_rev_8_21_14_0_20_57_5]|nr:MAG: hypothetical protein COV94_01595 [Candidatus Woesearchaeota archaeon CG11_big_fil_rev_8_21_14_0_20_57_5]